MILLNVYLCTHGLEMQECCARYSPMFATMKTGNSWPFKMFLSLELPQWRDQLIYFGIGPLSTLKDKMLLRTETLCSIYEGVDYQMGTY